MSLLSKICIRNFKSLRDVEIELGQLNVFIGENGVGKSNILEAIGLLSSAMSGTMDYSKLAERGVRLSTPEVFKSSFKYARRPKEIRIESEIDNNIAYNVTILPDQKDNRQQFFYKTEKIVQDNIRYAGRSHNGATINRKPIKKPSPRASVLLSAIAAGAISEKTEYAIQDVVDYGIYSPSTPILRGVAIDESRQGHLGLYGGGLAQALSSMEKKNRNYIASEIRKLFNWINRVGTVSPDSTLQSQYIHTTNRVVGFTDRYMNTEFNILYAYDVSEGALYALFVLCLLAHQRSPRIFSLDNIDSTLNPGLVRSLMVTISEYLDINSSKQILFTTHNPTTLDGIDLFNDAHRLFVVKRSEEDGSTKVTRITPPKNMTKTKWMELTQNMKLSELWLSGSIGALHLG